MIEVEHIHPHFTKYHLNSRGEEPWPFRPVLHKFDAPDTGQPHDHPWSFESFVLRGSYVERVWQLNSNGWWDSYLVHRKQGDYFTVSATHIHQIIELPDGECWTMAMYGPPEREVHFWDFSNPYNPTKVRWDERT